MKMTRVLAPIAVLALAAMFSVMAEVGDAKDTEKGAAASGRAAKKGSATLDSEKTLVALRKTTEALAKAQKAKKPNEAKIEKLSAKLAALRLQLGAAAATSPVATCPDAGTCPRGRRET